MKPIKQNSIQSYIRGREAIREKVDQIFQLFQEIDVIAAELLGSSLKNILIDHNFRWADSQKRIDFLFWNAILEMGLVTQVMTDNSRIEYLRRIEFETPEFVEHHVFDLISNIGNIYRDNAVQMIREVYNKLIGCTYGTWPHEKRDNLRKVNERFRCRGNIVYDRNYSMFCYNDFYKSRKIINFNDLLRVCYLIDGKNVGTYADQFSALAKQAFKAGLDIVNTEYFSVKCFRNGNQQVKWEASKKYVLKILNEIGGGAALPDHLNKRYKPEHFNGN